MKGRWMVSAAVLAGCLMAAAGIVRIIKADEGDAVNAEEKKFIALPKPFRTGGSSLVQALWNRRSVRHFSEEPLSLDQLSQLCWAGQGTSSPSGFRTSPSAGALYPLELYAAVGKVQGLSAGLYHYDPAHHQIERIESGDVRPRLSRAALNQRAVADAPVTLVITGVPERTRVKYGERAMRYVLMEAGHAGQNILLQAQALGLGAVPVGAFDDALVGRILGTNAGELPLYLIPVGIPSESR